MKGFGVESPLDVGDASADAVFASLFVLTLKRWSRRYGEEKQNPAEAAEGEVLAVEDSARWDS